MPHCKPFPLILSLLMLLTLLACQPAVSQPPVSAPAATEAAPPVTPSPQPVAPKNLVIVIPEDPPSFNAVISDSGYDALAMHLALLGMTEVEPSGQVYPVLAAKLPTLENGDVVVNADSGGMDVTWTLRNDIMWADGTPVTTDDVLFTYQAIIAA